MILLKNMMKAALVLFVVFTFTGCVNDDSFVIIEGPTKLYSKVPDSGTPKEDQVLAVLERGVKGKITSEIISKDFKFYRIKLEDGRQGYVWVGDEFRVSPEN